MIYFFIYLLVGACWANISEEFVFKNNGMTTIHKLLSTILWPLDIVIGGMSR